MIVKLYSVKSILGAEMSNGARAKPRPARILPKYIVLISVLIFWKK